MQWKTMASMGIVPALAMALSGCSSSGRTTVVQTWEDRPRFFTAEPGEDHSRFARVVWYERPRFFTRAEGEDQSSFGEVWDGRPRIFTSRTETVHQPVYSTTYSAPIYDSDRSTYRTIPVESRPTVRDYGGVPTHRTTTQETFYSAPPTPDSTQPRSMAPVTTPRDRTADGVSYGDPAGAPTYGSQTHRNITRRDTGAEPGSTATTPQPRVELTGDRGNLRIDRQIANWNQESRVAAEAMKAKYGPPDASTDDRLTWRNRDPFAEIVVFKDGTEHNHPDTHLDVLAHSIYYDVDAGKLEEIEDFGGNVTADHNRGLLTAKCNNEPMNILALNLAHQILTDKKSVESANDELMKKSGEERFDDSSMMELQFDVGVDFADETDESGTTDAPD